MKHVPVGLALVLVTAAYAAPASLTASAKSGSASDAKTSAEAKAICKDGTSYAGRTLRGACRGHGGIRSSATASAVSSSSGQPAR
jgi:hypothetical protein